LLRSIGVYGWPKSVHHVVSGCHRASSQIEADAAPGVVDDLVRAGQHARAEVFGDAAHRVQRQHALRASCCSAARLARY
jgi:hypothetical protein